MIRIRDMWLLVGWSSFILSCTRLRMFCVMAGMIYNSSTAGPVDTIGGMSMKDLFRPMGVQTGPWMKSTPPTRSVIHSRDLFSRTPAFTTLYLDLSYSHFGYYSFDASRTLIQGSSVTTRSHVCTVTFQRWARRCTHDLIGFLRRSMTLLSGSGPFGLALRLRQYDRCF